MKDSGAKVIGIGLICMGTLSMLINYNVIEVEFWGFWPFIILVIGLSFEIGFFMSKGNRPGLLVPGGILLTIGGLFVVCAIYGWHNMNYLWPLFIMAPGIGLLQLYVFGERESGALVPAIILLIIGGYFLVDNVWHFSNFIVVFSALLIVLGVVLIIPKKNKSGNKV
jgi:hypothetical protein